MFSITLKLMKKSARMLIPAGIAILIGTAFIASTFLFGNAMNDSIIRQQTAIYAGADAMVMPDLPEHPTDAQANEAYSRTVADYHLDRMRTVEGVKGVRAVTVANIRLSNGTRHATGSAINTGETNLLPVTVTHGDRPVDNREIALPEHIADQLGLRVGDTVRVASRWSADGSQGSADGVEARVTGLTDDPNGAYAYDGGASILSDDLMAAANGVSDFNQVNATVVYLDLGTKADTAAIDRLLPRYSRLVDRDEANRLAVESLSANGTNIVTTFLMGFGALAMLVAALVIANTFQVLVAQRRRTLALLRTIGAKKSQLYASVLFEAGVLGLIASMLGVALGTGLMAVLCASGIMNSTGMSVRLVMSWQVFAVPILFGMVMTIIASFGSARSATAVTPLEALRPIELTDTRRAGTMRAVLSTMLLSAGLALCAFGAWQIHELGAGHDSLANDHYGPVLLAAIAGCAFVFLALVLSAAFWLPLLMRGVGSVVALSGPSAKIAHANIQKNPRRVAATGAALLIGVTLVATIATGATSAKQTMGEALDHRYSVDMVAIGDMTDRQATEAAETKGVSASVYAPTTMMYTTTSNGKKLTVLLVGVKDETALAKVMKADLNGVVIGKDSVLLPRYGSTDGKPITFGKTMTFQPNPDGTDTGGATGKSITLKPQQTDFRRVSANYDAVAFVNEERFTDGDLDATGHMLLMRVDTEGAGVAMSDVLANVQQAFSASDGVTVSGPIAERSMWETMINGMMALLVGLIAVAVLIALVGVANTLSLSVIERTRESATLRAIGMTRGQLRRSLAVEALLLSLVSGVAGVLLGTGFGWLGSYMVFSLYGNVVFPFDWAGNGLMLGIAAVAALLASVAPARRAVSVPPVEALAEA
ncbi:ABC transporter permease [Bifidobacterium miconisargentati]|uniref:ABC transporter permease n=1 Tax=Bifidobacterium miconisargentati TaxID=2834437 RepID=UPI001BDC9EC3|nr:FtsX-like permease family protein [Bifidobacterium miconisargentati]MBW3089123.1 FtsX-like permease family protein [Bifidobacterium miconisargentati]